MIECNSCGDPLNSDEMKGPRSDRDDGKTICDDCYHDKYEFTCCDCCEYGDIDDMHKMLVVFEETSDVQPGIYKVIRRPYCTHAMIGSGWLHSRSLERVADLDPSMDGEGYPCGHLCKQCQERVLRQFEAKCDQCKGKSKSCLRVALGRWADFKTSKYERSLPLVVCMDCRHRIREITNGHWYHWNEVMG